MGILSPKAFSDLSRGILNPLRSGYVANQGPPRAGLLLHAKNTTGTIDISGTTYLRSRAAVGVGAFAAPSAPDIPVPSGANVYYMRADGTAANKAAATSPDSAATAMSVAKFNSETFSPGDIIKLSDQGGNYTAQLTITSNGVAGNPVVITNVDGENPTFDAALTYGVVIKSLYSVFQNIIIKTASFGVRFEASADNVYLNNITTSGTVYAVQHVSTGSIYVLNSQLRGTARGVAVTGTGSSYIYDTDIMAVGGAAKGIEIGATVGTIVVSGCSVHDCTDIGTIISGGTVTLIDCQIYSNGQSGIYASAGTVIVKYCQLYENSEDGISAGGTASITVICNTVFYNGSTSASTSGDGLTAHSTSTLNAYYNVVYGNFKAGIAVTQSSTGVIIGNTFYNNYEATNNLGWTATNGAGIAIDSGSTWAVENNITHNNGQEYVITALATGSITSDYNRFGVGRDASQYHYQGTNYATLSAFRTASSLDSNSSEGDPLFTDAANGDFTLQPTSPAIAAGTVPFSNGDGDQYDAAGYKIWSDDTDSADNHALYGWSVGAYQYPHAGGNPAKVFYHMDIVSGSSWDDYVLNALPFSVLVAADDGTLFTAGVPNNIDATARTGMAGDQFFFSALRGMAIYNAALTGTKLTKADNYFGF